MYIIYSEMADKSIAGIRIDFEDEEMDVAYDLPDMISKKTGLAVLDPVLDLSEEIFQRYERLKSEGSGTYGEIDEPTSYSQLLLNTSSKLNEIAKNAMSDPDSVWKINYYSED